MSENLLEPSEVVDFDQDLYDQNLKDNDFEREEDGKDGK